MTFKIHDVAQERVHFDTELGTESTVKKPPTFRSPGGHCKHIADCEPQLGDDSQETCGEEMS